MKKQINSFPYVKTVISKKTGIVIPVYFPEGIDAGVGEELLRYTVASFCEQVENPKNICLSVDGDNIGAGIASNLSDEFGVSSEFAQVNKGKLHAAGNGMRFLLEEKELDFIAVVDQDSDHFANELINFVRTALYITGSTGIDRVLVIGRRISRHRPMGFLRGELEELADRILLDALNYHAAVTGTPLRMEYSGVFDEFPDFHSGYKLFSRKSTEDVFLSEPVLSGVSEDCYYRHAVEAVMVVEALANGAYLGAVNRTTINEQPVSTFGLFDRIQFVADKIIWPCKRLGIPPPFVEQWLANHIPRLMLHTFAPDGKEELTAIRNKVLKAFGKTCEDGSDDFFQPLFI